MMKRTIKTNSAILALFLTACTSSGEWMPGNGATVPLSPRIQMEGGATRSVIDGVDASAGDGKINQVQLFITRNVDGHTIYDPKMDKGLSVFILSGETWSGTPDVNLSSDVARIYAFYPLINDETTFTPSTTDATHKIKVSIPAQQTFDGTKTWDCSTTDYLYGSASHEVGVDTPITANNGKETEEGTEGTKPYSPTISMQHALALLEFYLESESGRDVDGTYDFVKEVRLSESEPASPFRISDDSNNTMQISDGTLALTQTGNLTFSATSGTSQLCGKASESKLVAYGLVAPLLSEATAAEGGTPADFKVKLTVVLDEKGQTTANKRELSTTLTLKPWKKGNRYKVTLTLTDTNVSVTKTEVSSWGDGGSSSGEVYPDGLKPATP